MEFGHRIAREFGYLYAFVLGSEQYDPKVGYVPVAHFGIIVLEGINSENFMVKQLLVNAPPISGKLISPPEFGITY